MQLLKCSQPLENERWKTKNSIGHGLILAASVNSFLIVTFDCRYLFCCSYSHNIAPKGKYIAFVSTEAETDDPETELKPGIDLLGPVEEIFFDTYNRYEPANQHDVDNCFISTVSTLTFSFALKIDSIFNCFAQ